MPLKSWHLHVLQPVANLSFVSFYLWTFHTKARICLQILYPAILFTMLMEFLNRGSWILHILFAGNKQSIHIVNFPAGHTHFPSFYQAHNIIQIMHIREVVSKNYSPRGNFIKVWNTQGWKPSVFWSFIKLPRVDNFTNDRSPNVHNLFYKMVSKIWAVVSKN